MRISAVITFHNREQFIEEALQSVWSQTRPADEVIIVDDGSTAQAAQFLDKIAGPAKVVHLPKNQGTSVARNTGIARATGELIAFLDDDDIWLPDKLRIQAEYMEAHPEVSASHTGVIGFYQDGSEKTYNKKPSPLTVPDCLSISHITPPSLMMRAESLRKLNGFDAGFRYLEDLELQIRMVAAGHRVDFLPILLCRFRRQQHGNISGSARNHFLGWQAVLRKHRSIYAQYWGMRRARAHMLRVVGSRSRGIQGALIRAAAVVMSINLGFPKSLFK
jgi:glycosyltransferase involved in cell wall biosynthesis